MYLRLALVGNPNCGKTTLFNLLTGNNQHVGNWAGVTVERKSGTITGTDHELIDLPGIYSLSACSAEERITRDFLLNEKPDAIINVIDGTNFERNMYLTLQLAELGIPMTAAVNMTDEVESGGGSIDCGYLSIVTGIPFVPVSAKTSLNIDRLVKEAVRAAYGRSEANRIKYDPVTQNALDSIYYVITNGNDSIKPCFYYASKFLEGESGVYEQLGLSESQRAEIQKIAALYEKRSACTERDVLLADARYKYIEKLVNRAVRMPDLENKMTVSDKIDRIVTGRFTAFPVFALVMLSVFTLTFGRVGGTLKELTEYFFSSVVSGFAADMLARFSVPEWVKGMVSGGIIGGVGGVIVFLPQIAILFLCMSVLEDSGYMARAAFLTDRFLRRSGLSGKSFIPMLMGFGCTAPAVMAARTQENENERRMTIMLTPFMSCGAKLPVYSLFAGAFFGKYKAAVVASMYVTGIIAAAAMGIFLKKTLFKGSNAPFIMEMPPYRIPQAKTVLKNTWEKTRGFLVKAGTVIFSMSVVIWLLQSLTPSFKFTDNASESIFYCIGSAAAPLLKPLGFGTWQAAIALLSGLVAKEAVVSTMSILYAVNGSEAVSTVISGVFTPLSAYSFMLFVLLYIPCISAMAAIRRELGSLKLTLATVLIQTVSAYFVSFLVYQVGNIFIRV